MDRKTDTANPELDIAGSATGSRPLPTISIITPSLNQARFLPDCISSIASQSYRAVEHIIVDPGSTDGSRDIAAKAPSVTLIAEPDRGQSDAICKGFATAKGDVLAWLNSDDRYASSSVFEAVAKRFAQADTPDIVYGLANYIDQHGKVIRSGFVNTKPETLLESFEYQVGVVQPAVFMRRSVFEEIGGPLIDLHFAMDYEYWIRITLAGFKWAFVPMLIAEARWWPEMKTGSQRGESYAEIMKVVLRHFGYAHKKWVDRYAEYLTSGADGIIAIPKHRTPDGDVLISSKKKELYSDYNTAYNTVRLLEASQDRQAIADTVRDMSAHGILLHHHASPVDKARPTKNKSIPPAMASNRLVPGFYYYYAQEIDAERSLTGYEISDGFHWLFDRDWVERQLERFRLAIPSIHRDRGTDTCIIVGNGPSLNSTNLELLEGHDIIISNFAYLNKRLLGLAKYYTVVNRLVAEQGSYEINRLKSVAKFFPFWLAGFLRADEHTYFTNALLERQFSTNAADWLSWNSTVSFFNMQLAYSLGYRRVLLVGFDHDYKQGTNLKEGAIIDQKGDDEDHFDPSYFRGKVWQAADTGNMAHVYQLARDAFEADEREIINCTVGGKLEVFRRSTLEEELSAGIVSTYSYGKDSDAGAPSAEHPKVLIIDFTRMGGESATGQLKGTLFAGWPADRLMQVYSEGKGIFGVYRPAETGSTARVTASAKELAVTCESFAPDVILYRPVAEDLHIHDFALKIIDRLNAPLITQIVDDWPARLKEERPKLHEKLDASLRSLFTRSYACLSICDAMSIAFQERYGVSFTPIANCIEPDDWTSLDRERKRRTDPDEPLLIRYAGALASNKELESVVDVAQVVDSLQDEGIDVRLEVHTMPNWESKLRLLASLKGVSADASFLPDDEYRKLLVGCDALLLAYNFSDETIRYIRHSMANSLPEAMASGVPIIAYGPPQVATMAYAAGGKFALQVAERDHSRLRSAILELASHPEHGKELGSKARELAFEHHNSGRVRERFQSLLCEAAAQHEKPAIREPLVSAGHRDLVGPFETRLHADFNERRHPRLAKMYRWMRDKGPLGYLKSNYPTIITIGRFGRWGLAKLKKTLPGAGGVALLVIGGLYVAAALIESLRWYLMGIATALLLLGGGLLALSYARLGLNRFIGDQRKQVSDIRREVSDIKREVSDINRQVPDIKREVSDINRQVSNIKKEVAPYSEADRVRLERAVSIEKQVEVAELQYDLRGSKPVLFFNATSGPAMLSFASTAGLIISWALRLSGHRVLHLVCRKGLRRCIQGTNLHEANQPMPCEKCYAIKSKMFPQDLCWYLEPKSEVPSALLPLESYSLDDLADFVYQGIKIGELSISSVRWTLRRHRLDSDPRSTRLLREYVRGGMNIVDTLQRLLQEQELHSMVVFNGVFYPEAIARAVALQKGLPVVAYEISIPGLKVFLSHGVAAGGSLITIPEDFQMSATQEAEFDQYMSQRIRGTVGQPGLWPEMKGIEPDLQASAGQHKNVVSVFTNVVFDTSQYGTNTVFESMFDWLEEIMKLASLHPETLFVVRAHPAEVFPRQESEELVGDWLKEQSYLAIPNVRFIPPTDYISSYELLNISRFCLVYNSTIGLEAVVLGIPTVTAAAGRYIGAGVTHAPASQKAYRELVETFLKNGPPPVVDTVRQRARHYMYQLFFRQELDFSAFLESPEWTLKPIDASALHPDNSPEMNIIYKGIMEGGPFYYPP